ncbi:MAG: hypothetical protein U0L09_02360 [Christensenellales bacterium]|nr:hypothetical protein [Christensenellales bacterium]
MKNPNELFRRLEVRGAGPRQEMVLPVSETEPKEIREPSGSVRVMVPRRIRENSVYRQLMRSHDRMHTRHLKG